ncbi:flagellar biosynthesis protein FliO, partial [Acidovorax cavernicola]
MQQRQAMARGGDVTTRVLSAVAVGAHQRVVTVEVGEGAQKTRLVLGVTAQQIN